MNKRVLAIDFGASSGRAIIGSFDGEKISLEEVHRFSNDPVKVGDTMYWDVLRLFYNIKQGIINAKLAGGFDSIGIDTWGVDFGLIDEFGCLLENPVHYRDERTVGLIEECAKTVPNEEFYGATGIQFMELNTVYQLYALKKYRPHILERADRLLFMPDLFGYMLTGKMTTEYSIATTSQMVDIKTKSWATGILDRLGIPSRLLGEIKPSGSVLGKVRKDICEECGIDEVDVISVCGHDTQSALTKGEVSYTTKKPWRQKGTGRARAGYAGSPVWYHGGVAFAPKPRDYSYSLNKKVKRIALKSALSSKAAENEIIVIDGLKVEEIKTKAFKAFLDKVGVEKKALIVTENVDEKVIKSARNIAGVTTTIASILSPYMILTSGKMVVDKAALAKIEEVYA